MYSDQIICSCLKEHSKIRINKKNDGEGQKEKERKREKDARMSLLQNVAFGENESDSLYYNY